MFWNKSTHIIVAWFIDDCKKICYYGFALKAMANQRLKMFLNGHLIISSNYLEVRT